MITTVIVLLVIAVLAAAFTFAYNKLVKLRVRADEAFSGIDVALKRRADLIPNLVETVKGYAAHEQATFQQVTDARAATMGAKTADEKIAADAVTTTALANLMAVAEAYPELRAVESFTALQEELTSTENRVAFARQNYNANVAALNSAVATIPYLFVAGLANAQARPFWELDDPNARIAPTVSF